MGTSSSNARKNHKYQYNKMTNHDAIKRTSNYLHDGIFRELPTKYMMELILNNWLFHLNVDIKIFPVDVIKIIVDQYLYESTFSILNHVSCGNTGDSKDYLYDWDYLFKILIVGEWNTGKSTLILRFVEDTYDTERYKIYYGGTFLNYEKPKCLQTKTVKYKDLNIKLLFWNKKWSEMNQTGDCKLRQITDDMKKKYYERAHAILFCSSLMGTTDVIKEQIQKWNMECDTFTKCNLEKILVGTKCDVSTNWTRICSKNEFINIAKDNNIKHVFETSAKDNINIKPMFIHLIEHLMHRMNYPYLHLYCNCLHT
eukprot:471271_1